MADLTAILHKWFELIEVYDRGQHDNLISPIRDYNEHVRKAMELDETGITAVMIARNVLDDYLVERELPLKEVACLAGELFSVPQRSIEDFIRQTDNRLAKFLRLYYDLKTLLRDEDVEAQICDFQDALVQALRSVGFYTEEAGKLINDRYMLAEVRLSALKAFKTLKIDQVSRGKPGHGKPAFSNDIFAFFDVNTMLRMVAHPSIKDGLYLCLVRDVAQEEFSFFAFAVKNGENLWLVTDKPDLPSPNYKNVGRLAARERTFNDRVNAHLFPYELMDVKYDPDAARYVISHDTYTRAIQTFQPNWSVIGKISQTDPSTLLWLFMLFSLFQDRFFGEKPYQAEKQSYTAMMIETSSAGQAQNALMAVEPNTLVKFQPLHWKPLTTADLTNDNPEVAAVWSRPPTGQKEWMVRRYMDRIDNLDLLNHIATPGEGAIYIDGNAHLISAEQDKDSSFKRNTIVSRVYHLELTEFGTEEELRKKRIWFARRSLASAVQNLADKEFQERKDEIWAWYAGRVKENLPAIRRAIAHGKFISLATRPMGAFARNIPIEKKNVLHFEHIKDFSGYWRALKLNGPSHGRTCYFTDGKASIAAIFSVKDSTTIADMCGCRVEELPDVLQHIFGHEMYIGNSILETVDPVDSLHNPWKKNLDYDVVIFLSKRAYRAICREFGTTPIKIEPKESQ